VRNFDGDLATKADRFAFRPNPGGIAMLAMIRPTLFLMTLAVALGVPQIARASYTYQNYIQDSAQHAHVYQTVDHESTITVTSPYSYVGTGGPFPVDGTPQTITLYQISATSFSATPESIFDAFQSILFINEGSLQTSLELSVTLGGTIGIGDSGLTLQVSAGPTTVQLSNGDTFIISNFVYTAPTTNGASELVTATLVALPAGSVPEPSSVVLMGLGGVALLAGRRSRVWCRKPPV
jgi:PEP-CTERM motif